MANIAENTLSFDTEKDYLKFKELFMTDGEVDFNKIRPMPEMHSVGYNEKFNNENVVEYLISVKENIVTSISLYASKLATSIREEMRIKSMMFTYYQEVKDKTFKDCAVENGRMVYENVMNTGYGTPYEWTTTNWDTKWNAHESYTDDRCHTIYFSTAWNGVYELMQMASDMSGISFEYEVDSDEDESITEIIPQKTA